MKLQAYLTANGITQTGFAERLTEAINGPRVAAGQPPRRYTQQQVQSWCAGLVRPRGDDTMAAIFTLTGGQVTPNDFYNLPEAPAEDERRSPGDQHQQEQSQ